MFVTALLREGLAYAWLLKEAIAGTLDAADFVLLLAAVGGFSGYVGTLMQQMSTLTEQMQDIDRVRKLLDERETFRRTGGVPLPTPEEGHCFTLEGVCYTYPGAEKPTLKDVDVTIQAGEKIALEDLNGAGKTTLVKLLCGLLDPTGGRVLLNGIDIREFDRPAYYGLFCAVFQEYCVLPLTVYQNVAQDTAHRHAGHAALPGVGRIAGARGAAAARRRHAAGKVGQPGRAGAVRRRGAEGGAGPRTVQGQPGGGAGRAHSRAGPHRGERGVPQLQPLCGRPRRGVHLPPVKLLPLLPAHRGV